MAKNIEKQDPFVWKQRKKGVINREVLNEIRSNIDSFSLLKNCPSHNISENFNEFVNLEDCFSEKIQRFVQLYTTNHETRYGNVEMDRYTSKRVDQNADKYYLYRSNVEGTAYIIEKYIRFDSKRGEYYNDKNVTYTPPLYWSAVDESFYCYSGFTTNENYQFITDSFYIDFDVKACDTHYSNDNCTAEEVAHFGTDENNYSPATNIDHEV